MGCNSQSDLKEAVCGCLDQPDSLMAFGVLCGSYSTASVRLCLSIETALDVPVAYIECLCTYTVFIYFL